MAGYAGVPHFEGLGSGNKIYPYRQPAAILAACVGFFGLIGAIEASTASSNRRGLTLNGIIHMLPATASGFYWFLSIVSFAMALLGVYTWLRTHITHPAYISLSDTSITLPPSLLSSGTVSIEFASIRRLETVSGRRGKLSYYIHFYTTQGGEEKVHLMPSWLPEGAAQIVVSAIVGRSPSLQPAQV